MSVPGTWPKGVAAITLFVEDLDAARRFYRDVFEVEALVEDDDSTALRFGNTIVNLLKVGAADELVAPAAVGGPDSGARLMFTIDVDDVDATCAELTARGVELLNGPIDRPWGVRTAAFRDPGGHIWEIAT
jgi:catechol 2,3-dioxygenase-like lactoylglutathione lyase family enzyme